MVKIVRGKIDAILVRKAEQTFKRGAPGVNKDWPYFEVCCSKVAYPMGRQYS